MDVEALPRSEPPANDAGHAASDKEGGGGAEDAERGGTAAGDAAAAEVSARGPATAREISRDAGARGPPAPPPSDEEEGGGDGDGAPAAGSPPRDAPVAPAAPPKDGPLPKPGARRIRGIGGATSPAPEDNGRQGEDRYSEEAGGAWSNPPRSWMDTLGAYRIDSCGGTAGDGVGGVEEVGLVHDVVQVVPHATLVEEEEPPELVHGVPLTPPEPPSWWQRQRFWILLAASGAVLTALSVGLGISFSSAKVEEVASAGAPEGLFPEDIVAPLVAMRGDTAVVVTLFEAVRFFALTPSGLELVARINIGFWPDFVALDGDTVVISTRNVRWLGPGEASQANGVDKILPGKIDLGPGDVYVYDRRQNGAWREVARLSPHDPPQTGFGVPVAVDGDVLVMGVPDSHPGSVHVYRRNGTAWIEEATLTPPGNTAARFFSGQVSVKGTSVAVGDYHHGSRGEGAIFLYHFDPLSSSWNFTGSALTNSDCGEHFGSLVQLTNDAGMLATCGWSSADSALYHYERPGTREDYVLRQSIDFNLTIASMAVDGRAMVAAERRVSSQRGKAGGWPSDPSVIHFFLQRNNTWEEVAIIDEPTFDKYFGWIVAVSGNATLVNSARNAYLLQDYFHS